MIVEYDAFEFETPIAAIQWAGASGWGEAITIGGKNLVVAQTDCDRLTAAGIEFAYLNTTVIADGREVIVTIPIN